MIELVQRWLFFTFFTRMHAIFTFVYALFISKNIADTVLAIWLHLSPVGIEVCVARRLTETQPYNAKFINRFHHMYPSIRFSYGRGSTSQPHEQPWNQLGKNFKLLSSSFFVPCVTKVEITELRTRKYFQLLSSCKFARYHIVFSVQLDKTIELQRHFPEGICIVSIATRC